MAYPVFPIIPRDDDIIERIEWMTNVMETWSGEEQRVKLRELPRRSTEFAFNLTKHDVSLFDAAIFKNIFKHNDPSALLKYTVPFWWDMQALAYEPDVNDTTIPCTTPNYAFVVGGLAVIISATRLYDRKRALKPDDYEAFTITEIADTYIRLAAPGLVGDWALGDYLLPAGEGILDAIITDKDLTDLGEILEGRVRLECSPEAINVEGTSMDIFMEAGYVFPVRTLNQITRIFDPMLMMHDNLTGTPNLYRRRSHPQLGWQVNVELRDRSEIQILRDYIDAFEGKWKPFWLPSWNYDIRPISLGTTEKIVARAYAYEAYGDDEAKPSSFKRFFALWDGETLACKEIASVDRDGDSVEISFGTAVGEAVDVDSYELICYLYFVRMMQDGFDIHHHVGGNAECSFGAVQIPADFATG